MLFIAASNTSFILFSSLLFLLFLFLLLKGFITPKLGLFVFCIAGIFFYLLKDTPLKSLPSLEQKAILEPETKAIISEKETTPLTQPISKQPKKERPKTIPEKQNLPQKEVTQHLTTVQIKGIQNKNTLQFFSEKSGYSVSKNGDYTLEFTHTGNSKKDNSIENNRFIFSGGHLIVKVNEEKCCCASQIPIPSGLALGKTMKTANQTLSDVVEKYTSENLDLIIPMISECLPQI